MKKEVKKRNEGDKPEGWVDVTDDNQMRANGFFRPFDQAPRDPDVWTKTAKERKAIKAKSWKNMGHFNSCPRKFIQVRDKLIIQLKKNKEYPKTTYSIECWQSDIPEILSKYIFTKNKQTQSLVSWYKFNGKTVRC